MCMCSGAIAIYMEERVKTTKGKWNHMSTTSCMRKIGQAKMQKLQEAPRGHIKGSKRMNATISTHVPNAMIEYLAVLQEMSGSVPR
jgi:hypothetical protein